MITAEITAFLQTEGKVRFDEIVREDVDFDTNFDQNSSVVINLKIEICPDVVTRR